MGLNFGSIIVDFAVVLIVSFFTLIIYYKWAFNYWKRRNVPFMKPKIPFGSSENPFDRKEYIGIRIQKRYDEFKALGHKHGGLYMFTSPSYIVIDPEYIKNIMAKDFRYFANRGTYYNEKGDPLSAHLFNLEGQKWKTLRHKLTPTFTSGKMKMMFPILIECGGQLINAMDEFCEKNEPVEVKEVLGCFTTDVIGSCALGLECNSFKNPQSEFKQIGKKIFTSITKVRTVSGIIALASPNLARALGIVITPKDISEFFINVVKKTVEYRKKSNSNRQDFMQLLIELKDTNGDFEGFTVEEMAAQAFAFFLAGFETSSTTMSFCLFELALNPEIQEKVREELFEVMKKHNGDINYDSVMDLKYMGQVVDETLRKYPPAPLIPRVCVEDYQVEGTNVTLEKGTRVLIPVYALHHDPEFYPNPYEFDPDRFSIEEKAKRHPFTYLPFGEGPRICIGLRFGLMQTKVGLAMLLRNYSFSISDKTKLPLEIDSTNLILTSKDGIWLELSKLVK